MATEGAFTWGGSLPVVKDIVNQTFKSIHVDPHVGFDVIFTSTLLLTFAFIAGKKFRQNKMLQPSGKLDISTFTELTIGGLYNFTKGFIGEHAKHFFFLTGSLTLFILLNNLIGLVPGFNPPTDQFNTTIVLGIIVFITTHVVGIKQHGFSYIKHFIGPIWWLAPLMFVIELISHLVRPLSLAIRLFGNMTGDHKVVGILFMLAPFGLILPVPMMGMGILVSCIQTLVFLILTLVYISGSLEHAH